MLSQSSFLASNLAAHKYPQENLAVATRYNPEPHVTTASTIITSISSRFVSATVDQTPAYCSSTAWSDKPLPSAQRLAVPLFIAGHQYIREGNIQFRLFDWFSSKHLSVAVLP